MSLLADDASHTDIPNRLKRAEGQLRGFQRMIEQDETCLDIASQMSAVRKALDSASVRMTACFMQQELLQHLSRPESRGEALSGVLGDVQALRAKVR